MTLDEELTRLCKVCGACCDGTLFAWVELEMSERARQPPRRLPLVREGTGMVQPCEHHGAEGCSIYEDRPAACRSYRCALFDRHRDERGSIETRIERVEKLRAVAARVRTFIAGANDRDRGLWELLQRHTEDDAAWLQRFPELALDVAELALRLRRDFGVKLPSDLPASGSLE
jgi:Fe-S-cluster containining protein